MSTGRATGLPVESTKPSRAAKRAEAARVRTDTAATEAPAAAAPTSTPNPTGHGLPMKKVRKRKSPFATQIQTETVARLEWVTSHGASLTDMTDTALNEYLDRAGVPRPDENGKMPD